MSWRYLAQRLDGTGSAGELLDTALPLTGVALTTTLSGPGRLTGSVPVEVSRLQGPDGRPLLQEWGTAIWAEKDDVIRGGGILVASDFDGPTWKVDCMGLSGYAAGMPFTDAWYGVEIDPLDVVRYIWAHIQSKPGGNLGLTVDGLKTGLKIGTELEQAEYDTQEGSGTYQSGPVKLNWYETTDLGGEIDTLAKSTPFEYRERTEWAGDYLSHRLELGYPTLGRRRDDLRFVIGENLAVIPSVKLDGESYANEVLGLGAGEGRDMLHATVAAPDGRLRRVVVATDKQQQTTAGVAALARGELLARQGLLDVTSVTVRNHGNAPIGSWDVGDEILLQGRAGWIELDDWVRVVGSTISPDTGDAAVLDVVRVEGA